MSAFKLIAATVILTCLQAPCQAAEYFNTEYLRLPPKQADGRIPTLNKMGWVLTSFDPYTKEFIKYVGFQKEPVLEIGAAYGFAVLEVLKKKVPIVANDLDERHLKILEGRTPSRLLSYLSLKPGKFPNETPFADNQFAAVLAVRVFAFFTGEELETAIKEIFRILKPGGKVFIVADTPYTTPWKNFIPVYEKRKKMGYPYPGFIEDPKVYNPKRATLLNSSLHFLDLEVLLRLLQASGFDIIKTEYLNRHDYPKEVRLDGRENICIIAAKPLPSGEPS